MFVAARPGIAQFGRFADGRMGMRDGRCGDSSRAVARVNEYLAPENVEGRPIDGISVALTAVASAASKCIGLF